MFHSARIKLTLWYLVIIMVITLLFSFIIYTNVNQEFNRIETFEKVRQEENKKNFNSALEEFRIRIREDIPAPKKVFVFKRLDPEMIQQARMRFIMMLAIVDAAILVLSGIAGYFLAGKTLRPIKEMVDDQNRFITDASHELRTPITALKSSIEVNLRDKKMTIAQAKDVLKSNLEEVNNLQILANNLIQLTQYPKAAKKIYENLSIKDILAESVKKVTPMAQNKHITITLEAKEGLIKGEKQSLVELFVIILDNAIKYSNEKTKITVSVKKIVGKISITITDEGIGIAEKDIPHIFERFYRSDVSRTKREVSGYGLGLAIAHHIVISHNGSIHVKSTVGKGATFTILLPKG